MYCAAGDDNPWDWMHGNSRQRAAPRQITAGAAKSSQSAVSSALSVLKPPSRTVTPVGAKQVSFLAPALLPREIEPPIHVLELENENETDRFRRGVKLTT